MPLRALLFSSDPETSRRLAQAFRELDFSVEHCPEIFAAVERITAHRYEVVVADWDDGVEAMFLVKTARELRLNCDAFRIVAAKPEAATAATNSGAQIVVSKPALPGHTKYALLTSDEFVRRMKTWEPGLTQQLTSKPPQPAPTLRPPLELVANQDDDDVRESQLQVIAEDAGGMVPRAGSAEESRIFSSSLGRPVDSRPRRPKSRLRPVLYGALVAGGLSAAYFSSTSFNAQASSEVVPAAKFVSPAAVTTPAPSRLRADSQLTIQVSPRPEEVTEPENKPTESETPPVAPQSEQAEKPEPAPAILQARIPVQASIPDSLSVPLQPEIGAKASVPKHPPALLSGVEPMSLAADLAEKSLLQRVVPEYPAKALQSKLQGAVILQAWISKDGKISDLKVIRGPLGLCEAAYTAVKQWRYKPFQLNGQSVEAKTYVTVNFELPPLGQ
jgi:protein TonB